MQIETFCVYLVCDETRANVSAFLLVSSGSALPPRHPAGSESPGQPQQGHAAGQSRHRPGPPGDGGHRC